MAPSRTTGLSPFKVVHGIEPLSPLALTPRPLESKPSPEANKRVEEIQQLHEQVENREIQCLLSSASQQAQEEGGLPTGRPSLGPFEEGEISFQKKDQVDAKGGWPF